MDSEEERERARGGGIVRAYGTGFPLRSVSLVPAKASLDNLMQFAEKRIETSVLPSRPSGL